LIDWLLVALTSSDQQQIFHTYSGQEQIQNYIQGTLNKGGMCQPRQQLLTNTGKVLKIG
jgi:hypothetical protein